MNISDQSYAVLLLTTWFTKPAKGEPRPLSPTEWGRFARFLHERGSVPEDLIKNQNPAQYIEGWIDKTVNGDRIRYLLGRSTALSIALERWQRAGLWVMTRSESDYPLRLKKHLKFDAPPVLFGCGNRQLLNQGGIAVIGSRDVGADDLDFTTALGREIASQGFTAVSGGARGVDEAAMLGALSKDGTVIGVLSEGLLRASSSAKYRPSLMDKNLVLVTPFNPEAGFDVGNAMARNKYIYCLADAAIVVTTSKDKGGTWSGATENLKKGWTPLWVKSNNDESSGNAALVRLGAKCLPDSMADLQLMTLTQTVSDERDEQVLLSEEPTSDTQVQMVLDNAPELDVMTGAELNPKEILPQSANSTESQVAINIDLATKVPEVSSALSLYEYFLLKLKDLTNTNELDMETLQVKLGLGKSQLSEWLKSGVAEGSIEKIGKPARYRISRAQRLF